MKLPALLLDVDHKSYHDDALPGLDVPTLSRSVAEILNAKSPHHAWRAHPRLGGSSNSRKATASMDAGTFLHDRFLGGGPEIVVIDAPDWRPRKAFDPRPIRDEAIAAGKIPMLPHELEKKTAQEDSLRSLVLSHPAMARFDQMERESVIVWEDENGVVWRCRLDLFDRSRGEGWDLKFTEDASTAAIQRAFRWGSHALQAAVYEDAMNALTPDLAGRNTLHFLFAEFDGGGVRSARPAPTKMSVAEAERRRASKLWKKCLKSGEWPGYPAAELLIEATSFEMSHELDQQIAESETNPEPDWMKGEEP